ncbi:deoxyribodipyrimidine photolyase [Xaviernesmea oryzae]|uniref:Deoxyribodipyrimidine photo-lyase n=1 Tax=Xaviernesmea oryzae TaxID=464029 RepID=A0A1Q9AWP2_9HYPH|nr:deoxyribodipyrimidine photo-lyase [Xaviernesmea oryzae]OLP59883.1 deoxyribodipyrimidine photolyase [Xaviernesmea oryzae]SEK47296.1 deoxyribodipyrimidine photo-lyase [Xaviernesmea oryzae]
MNKNRNDRSTSSGSAPTILWLRKDLRLGDHHALKAAADRGVPVVALYIREPGEDLGPLGPAQSWWLHHSLARFDEDLQRLGNRLILRSGEAGKVIETLIAETGADTVYWNRRYDPAGSAADTRIKAALEKAGVAVQSFAGQLLHEPMRMKTKSGTPFRVYAPFWRAFEAQGEPDLPVDAPSTLPAPAHLPKSESLDNWALLPTQPDWASEFSAIWTPGEAGARDRLERFVEERLKDYRAGRETPARDGSSGLSPHLAMGEISPATVWHATNGLSSRIKSDEIVAFRREIVWREYAYHLLVHHPDLPRVNINRRFDRLDWQGDEDDFRRWCRGETGFPIVDAGMRQLWRHGAMHNRVRMIAASFLVKDLLIDWRRGEAWFRHTLVDADPANNGVNWQWVAGCGADAAPFFRVFNPILQGEKFDPKGIYVRRFVPEVAKLPDRYIHRPFEAPASVLAEACITLGKTYPKPQVDHAKARDRALSAYRSVKDAA